MQKPEQTKLFPYILAKLDPNLFNYKKCKFSMARCKEGTSRVAVWKMLRIPAVYTLETSLCGGALGSPNPHYTPETLAEIGRKLCQAIIVYQNIKPAIDESPLTLTLTQQDCA